MKTYRYRGHSMSDPAKYRTKEEVEKIKDESDPLINLKKHMLESAKVDEEAIKSVEKSVTETMKEVVEFSKQSPEPDASELYTDILID